MKASQEDVLNAVTEHYLTSGDFNGTPLRDIEADDAAKREIAEALLRRGAINLNFGDRHPNPYVQALPPDDVEAQLSKLRDATDITHACMYPSPEHLASVVNRDDFRDRPFTLRLALGEPSLTAVPFDLRVLEHYRNDPRYHYDTDGIQGSIGVRDKFYQKGNMREADEVLLNQFGFGYNDAMDRCVVAMLCDLADLTPEHQQAWSLQRLEGDYLPHPNFTLSVMGHWPERESIFTAFVEELRVINCMAAAMGRPHLFRHDFAGDQRPREFGFLVRPTLREFNGFVLLLDRMLSDNMDVAFFRGEVPLEFLEERPDGTKIARQKGSIRALQEWLEATVQFPDPGPKDAMIAAFKKVRKLRQSPAHAVRDDDFDQKYARDQRQLMIEAYKAVRDLRLILANEQRANACEVQDWLRKGEIWTY